MIQSPAPDPRDNEPLRDGTSLMAFLHILRKAHTALVGQEKAHLRFHEMHTRGHAKQYIEELMPMLLRERENHRQRYRRKKG
ncbi:MAG TPA: hypothetical protein VL997_05825 [Dyella sp.]|nr:hypothetical protein [Dyella sp.]